MTVFADKNGSVYLHQNVDWHLDNQLNIDNDRYFFEAVPNQGYYFERWILLDRYGFEMTIPFRCDSPQLMNFYSRASARHINNFFEVYGIKAIFTNDETKLVYTVQPPVSIYGTGNITVYGFAQRKVAGTVLIARMIADENTIITRWSTLHAGNNEVIRCWHYRNAGIILTWGVWWDIHLDSGPFGQAERIIIVIAER